MTLVAQLRMLGREYWQHKRWYDGAADRIERLEAALREIIDLKPEDMPHATENSMAAAIARAALD